MVHRIMLMCNFQQRQLIEGPCILFLKLDAHKTDYNFVRDMNLILANFTFH